MMWQGGEGQLLLSCGWHQHLPLDVPGLLPVHVAVQVKSLACLELLVRKGADVNAAERQGGRTPLHLAVEMDNLNMAAHLVKKVWG